MANDPSHLPVNTEPDAIPQRSPSGLSIILLVFLSVVICTAGVLAARGNGLPPSLYGGIAVVLAPLFANRISRIFRTRRRIELLILLLCGLGCAALAWTSSRITPGAAFVHIFKTAPPSSALAMQARKQWYDGRIWLLRFDLPESDFQKLVASSGIQPVKLYDTTDRYLQRQWDIYIAQWSGLAHQFWPSTPPEGKIEIYQSAKSNGLGEEIVTNIFRDKITGRTWIVRLD